MTPAERLEAQTAFLIEADKLKSVLRASCLIDNSRFENTAEHSWHIMLYALVMAEHAGPDVQIDRVLKMLLLHDLVEIDAGDAPIHADVDRAAQARAEEEAADRLFGLLPADQRDAFRALWDEFEAAATPDAVFAKAIDRVQTPIANLENGGGSWKDFNVTLDQLDTRVGIPIARGAPRVWAWLRPRLSAFFARSAG
ncbi:HD family hydrolase [Thalassococcus sp. S3]|uniref:HD domain-containing protein n=1 Tax=Thalassococcus sp. S3 TaxID=2017482 RepID=UPI00102449F6|nr:HD domain-containing protein [Thalassococcus sp. S3]QBF31798.1 hydrolase [Thalassococcus sp. S3]